MNSIHTLKVVERIKLNSITTTNRYLSLVPESLVAVIQSKYGKSLTASTNIKANEIIVQEAVTPKNVLTDPTRYTIRKSDKVHLNVQSEIRYTNHSFSPNACVKFPSSNNDDEHLITLESILDIKKGQEVTFDYKTTEGKLAEPFMDECTGKKVA